MKLITQPNKWTCLPTSVAMLLNISLDDIFKIVGHDGSQILWKDFPDPQNRRGFHIQEMYEVIEAKGWFAMPFDLRPYLAKNPEMPLIALEDIIAKENLTKSDVSDIGVNIRALKSRLVRINGQPKIVKLMDKYDGIMIGLGSEGRPHAAAWNHTEQKIYDPSGQIKEKSKFTLETLVIINQK